MNTKVNFHKSIFIVLLFFLNAVKAEDLGGNPLNFPHLSSFYYSYKANQALKNKNPESAFEYMLKVLETESYSASVHSNMGVVFDYMQKKDEAEKSFQQSLKIVDQYKNLIYPSDLFQVYYNLGAFYGAAKKIDEALVFYQRALDIDPASIETKHNIELLIQQQQQQQQQGSDQKESQDKTDQSKNNDKNKDNKDQDKKDQKDQKDQDNNDQKDQNKDRAQSPKYQPRPFKGDQLSEGDVKKILGELSEQDKKIRANFNKKDRKEGRHDKDW